LLLLFSHPLLVFDTPSGSSSMFQVQHSPYEGNPDEFA
jgi:hypothetical protein